jgi:hypothetical protein
MGENIYTKLQKARCELQNKNIKKSGKNKFSGYTYYELGDILPVINQLAEQYKFIPVVSFGDVAILEIINAENPSEKITFLSPLSTANLKGCHEVQNLGAVQTYLRRYLYMNAFEIVEHDNLEPVLNNDDDKKNKTITVDQAKQLFSTAKGKKDVVQKICSKYKYLSTMEIKEKDFEKIIAEILMEV